MARYIDADTLKRHYCWWTDEYKEIFDDIIDVQPTADVRENVRGKWIKGGEQPYFRKHFDIVVCSVCNKRGEHRWNYCPDCGADMRGRE